MIFYTSTIWCASSSSRSIARRTPYEMLHASAGQAIRDQGSGGAHRRGVGPRTLRIEHDPKGPTIKTSFALDNRRARDVFGWQPQVSFDDGVRRTIDWWRKTFERAS